MPEYDLLKSIDEFARRRFEAAWAEGTPRPIDEFLPAPDDPRHRATLEELILIELEFAWKGFSTAGSTPGVRPARVEDYLTRFPQLKSPETVERLAREEFLIRRLHGDGPSAAEYRDRFPELPTVGATVATLGPDDRPAGAGPAVAGYEVLGVLGAGGMGVVYEAREARLGRAVALKTSRGAGAEMRARFLAEARVAARLEHPGVVPVHELVTPPDGEPFYTMKLVRGRTLADAVRAFHAGSPRGADPVASRRLLDRFLVVAQTMAFAHQKGVIHRDLKPANIVLGEYGETVILDWGLAKVLRDGPESEPAGGGSPADAELTAHGAVLGTPAYMPPEQAAGRTAEVDERSDVYALGAILYQILTGTYPHHGAGPDLFRAIQDRDPPRPSALAAGVPRPLEAVCLKALARNKADRYPGAKALADDVERFLAGEPVSVYRERAAERFARWRRRNRTLVAAGTVALVLLAVGAAVAVYYDEVASHKRREQQLEFDARQAQERQREEGEKREAAQRGAQTELARGLVELKTGRFSLAEQTFHKGFAALPAGAEFPERPRLAELHDAARRLATFTRYRERADRLALGTNDINWTDYDDAVIGACETGLRAVGVVDGPPDWWTRLPDGELLEPQRRRLREDASATLGLLAMWRTKRGFVRQLTFRLGDAKADFRATVDLLGRIQAFVRVDTRRRSPAGERGSPAAEVLEFFCRLRLGESPAPPRLPLVIEDAPDLYFLGTTHLFLAFADTGSLVGKLKLQSLGTFPTLSGLDFDTPLVTAEWQLRAAVALDPGYHMAHYWFGRCLLFAKKYSAAEQAFNACVALRPDYAPAYTARVDALLIEARNVTVAIPPPTCCGLVWVDALLAKARDTALRTAARMRELALRGVEAAPPSIREEPDVRWAEARCLSFMQRAADTGRIAADATEMEVVRRYRIAASPYSVADGVLKYQEARLKNAPDQPEVRAAVAVAALALARDRGRHAQARREAARALALDPANARALAVRGMLRLMDGEAAEALRDFEAARAASPRSELATVGRAWAMEQLGDWGAALKAYSALLPVETPATGSRHLQPLLGRARALVKLGRPDEARRALDEARDIDPVATDALAAELFPAARK